METYILEILENNNRVIVPEFGAFIVKQREPLTIIFNEFLQYNDGMLVDHISKTSGISRDDAKEQIDAFVSEVTKSLEFTGTFTLKQIGIIKKSSAGKISIGKAPAASRSTKKTTKASTSKKMEVQKAEEKTEAVKESKPEKTSEKPEEKKIPDQTKAKTEPSPEVKKETTAKTESKPAEPKDTTTKPPSEKTEEKTQKVAETKKQEPESKDSSEKAVKESSTPPEKKPRPVSKPVGSSNSEKPRSVEYNYQSSSSGSRKKRKKNILLWIIIIALVNGAIITYFILNGDLGSVFNSRFEDESIDYLESEILIPDAPEDDAAYDENKAVKEDAIVADKPVSVEAPVKEEVEQTTRPKPAAKSSISSGPRFYIVAGVFRDENNADNLVSNLQSKGYNSEKFGKIGNLHAVSYEVFYTKDQANKALRKIQAEEDPDSWIRIAK